MRSNFAIVRHGLIVNWPLGATGMRSLKPSPANFMCFLQNEIVKHARPYLGHKMAFDIVQLAHSEFFLLGHAAGIDLGFRVGCSYCIA